MPQKGFFAWRLPGHAVWYAALVFLLAPLPVRGTEYYASTTGSPHGSGTLSSPWDLQTALSQSRDVKPGDTVWLLGGVYKGIFRSALKGAPEAPIIVRQYPGQRAIIDGSLFPAATFFKTTLTIDGCCAWYWGFEIANSDPRRTGSSPGSNPPDAKGFSVTVGGPDIKLINLVIHDTGAGPGVWSEAENAEIYGNIVYYNGWQDAFGRPDGHALYVNNPIGVDILDNIMFDSFGHGIHAYGHFDSAVDNHRLQGNILFNNGALTAAGYQRNILIGNEIGGRVARNPAVIENYTYFPLDAAAGENNLGYGAGCAGAVVSDNYFVGGLRALALVNCTPDSMTGNVFVGATKGIAPGDFSKNQYFRGRPAGVSVFVRKNRYDPRRAHIVVYNWDKRDTVAVDLGGVLSLGQSYRVLDVQDYFGTPAAGGVFDGAPVQLEMNRAAISVPVGDIGQALLRHTSAEFGVFVLLAGEPQSGAIGVQSRRPDRD